MMHISDLQVKNIMNDYIYCFENLKMRFLNTEVSVTMT